LNESKGMLVVGAILYRGAGGPKPDHSKPDHYQYGNRGWILYQVQFIPGLSLVLGGSGGRLSIPAEVWAIFL
jgi:hypothetical protein